MRPLAHLQYNVFVSCIKINVSPVQKDAKNPKPCFEQPETAQ